MSSSNAPTLLQAIPPALSFLVPLFAVVLLLLAVSHRPTHPQGASPDDRESKRQGTQALVAYIAIGTFALLSTLAGALGLKAALGSDTADNERVGTRGKGELVMQALISLELGVSVLYLASKYVNWVPKVYLAIGLVIPLLCATLVSILFPALPNRISPSLPPALSLVFTLLTLPILVYSLRVYMAKQKPNSMQQPPIVQTEAIVTSTVHHVPIPLTLSVPPPSPASSSASLPSPRFGHEKIPSASSSISDLTVVNHYRSPPLSVSFTPQDGQVDAGAMESGTNTNDDRVASVLRTRIVQSRSRSLLVFLIVAQSAALLSFVLDLAAASVVTSTTRHSASTLSDSAVVHAASVYALLLIIRTALMVLCITGIMSAYLLHTYNAYLRGGSMSQQNTTDTAVLPPAFDISRSNAITVSLSTDSNAPPLSASKKRPSLNSFVPSAFDRTSYKFGLKGRFSNAAVNAVNSQVVFSEATHDDNNEANNDYGNKASIFKSPSYSRHGAAVSVSSSFTSPRPKRVPLKSVLMSPDPVSAELDKRNHAVFVRDSKFDEEEMEAGYAYIYETRGPDSKESEEDGSTDPLDVGLPVPFRPTQIISSGFSGMGHMSMTYSPPNNFTSFHHSHSDSSYTNEAVENGNSPTLVSSPLTTPTASIPIPLPKPFANPYPTPRSTPTSAAFTALSESASIAESSSSVGRSTLFFDASRPTTASTRTGSFGAPFPLDQEVQRHRGESHPTTSSSRWESIGAPPFFDQDVQGHRGTFSGETAVDSRCSTPTPTPTRSSTPTPTPTRAPTPGLHFSPFVGGNIIRKRDSTSSKTRSSSPIAPSAFMANFKNKAKSSMLTKHESISGGFAQGLEGIRHGLGNSGKTKNPLRASSSHSNLGLGISSGFKFPQLSRRASEIEKRSGSSGGRGDHGVSETGHVDDGDFMDLRDPFASPSVGEGGVMRMASPVDLNLRRGGRESRNEEREWPEYERDGVTWYGRSKSAWGKLPLTGSGGQSGNLSKEGGGAGSLDAGKGREGKQKQRHKNGKAKDRSRRRDGNGGSGKNQGGEDVDFDLEEALLAQQLLMRLDGDFGLLQSTDTRF